MHKVLINEGRGQVSRLRITYTNTHIHMQRHIYIHMYIYIYIYIVLKTLNTLIDSADTLKELRKKELYWMYKLKTYPPYGHNERDVYEAF